MSRSVHPNGQTRHAVIGSSESGHFRTLALIATGWRTLGMSESPNETCLAMIDSSESCQDRSSRPTSLAPPHLSTLPALTSKRRANCRKQPRQLPLRLEAPPALKQDHGEPETRTLTAGQHLPNSPPPSRSASVSPWTIDKSRSFARQSFRVAHEANGPEVTGRAHYYSWPVLSLRHNKPLLCLIALRGLQWQVRVGGGGVGRVRDRPVFYR